MERTDEYIFRHSATAGDYIVDLACAIVEQILRRDANIREEDYRRIALSAESLA